MRHVRVKSSMTGLLLIVILALGSGAQQTGTLFVNQLRLDLRPLGHPPLDVIPPGESVTSYFTIYDRMCRSVNTPEPLGPF